MNPPVTYSDWNHCLDRLVAGTLQLSDLPILDAGKIEWSKGSAERFAKRFTEAYDQVLKQCADRLQKQLTFSANQELDIIKALNLTRRTLELLFQITIIKPIPEDLRNCLQNLIDRYVKQAQASLEQSAKADRSGRLATLLKHHSLLNFNKQRLNPQTANHQTQPTNGLTDPTASPSTPVKPQRRIIL